MLSQYVQLSTTKRFHHFCIEMCFLCELLISVQLVHLHFVPNSISSEEDRGELEVSREVFIQSEEKNSFVALMTMGKRCR